jgi:hypothetical protein
VSVHQAGVGQESSAERSRVALARFAAFLEQEGTLVIVVTAFVIALITHLRLALEVDGWMALLSGRVIAQHGLPTHNTLTLWAHGHHWTDQQWLAQFVLYQLERLGGLRLVLLVHAALTAAGLAVAAALARRLGGSARSTNWVCIPVLAAYWRSAVVMRPQSFSYVLFAAVLWLLLDDRGLRSRRIYLVLPLLVLWANLHGSVVVGAALVSLYGLVELVGTLRRSRLDLGARPIVLLIVPWLCLLASPYAASLPGYYREILFSGGFGSYVTEWAPTTLTYWSVPFYLLVVGGLWLLGRSSRQVSAFEALAFLGLIILGFDAGRNCVWLALFALILLPRLLDALRSPAVEPRRLNRILAVAMLVGVVVATGGVAAKSDSWFTQAFPSAASDAAAATAGSNDRIFANEEYADWLIWKHPELAGRLAYDSRFELLTQAQLQAVSRFRGVSGNWLRTAAGYTVFVLDRQLDRDAVRALLRRGVARVVHTDGNVIVLRRTAA